MTTRAATSQFKGAMKDSSGKVQAHSSSGVVMDIAAFKVSHTVNIDATGLQAARARSSSNRGHGTLRVWV